jgi:hypothetical protein
VKQALNAAHNKPYRWAHHKHHRQHHNNSNVNRYQLHLLSAPTERPDEPITAGNPLGAGPGMDMLPQPMPMGTAPGSRQDLINQVRYIYSKTPNTALLQLILELENVSI